MSVVVGVFADGSSRYYAHRVPMLAGIPVADADVETLAAHLREAELPDTAEKLEKALLLETRVLALTSPTARASCTHSPTRRGPTSPSSDRCSCASTSGACARGSCRRRDPSRLAACCPLVTSVTLGAYS
jgi:hypothetical protein